jgi:hypothetical protein
MEDKKYLLVRTTYEIYGSKGCCDYKNFSCVVKISKKGDLFYDLEKDVRYELVEDCRSECFNENYIEYDKDNHEHGGEDGYTENFETITVEEISEHDYLIYSKLIRDYNNLLYI